MEKNKEEILTTVAEKSAAAELKYDICAYSTLVGLKSCFSFIPDEMVAASRALAGGVASTSGSCGAFCCGLLAIGAKYFPMAEEDGLDFEESQRRMAIAREKIEKFKNGFLEQFKSSTCPGVQKLVYGYSYNLNNDNERTEFLTLEGHREKCAEVISAASRMAAKIIMED